MHDARSVYKHASSRCSSVTSSPAEECGRRSPTLPRCMDKSSNRFSQSCRRSLSPRGRHVVLCSVEGATGAMEEKIKGARLATSRTSQPLPTRRQHRRRCNAATSSGNRALAVSPVGRAQALVGKNAFLSFTRHRTKALSKFALTRCARARAGDMPPGQQN